MKLRILILVVLSAVAGAAFALDLNVVDLGARGDGTTDNTAIFQKALDQAGAAGGGTVRVPAGRFKISGNLVVPAGVTLQGTHLTAPHVSVAGRENPVGSALLAYAGRGSNEGEPFIRLSGESSTLAGFIIIYPEWKREDVPPVPYPPCVASESTNNIAILNCNILNAYEAIRLVKAHRHLVRNVHGYPIWRGLYTDEIYDIGRLENVHFCPFAVPYKADDPYSKWINLNGVAFEFARTDWQYVTNTFCFGYGVGYKFSASDKGVCNGSFLSIGADSCRRAILVEDASGIGLLITNGEFVGRWDSTDSACVEIAEKAQAKVSITNSSFWGPNDRCVWLRAPKSQLTVNACNFVSWDIGMQDSPAIAVDTGSAIIQGNTFGGGAVHIRVLNDATSTIVLGNQAANGLVVENHAGHRTQMMANQQPPVTLTEAQKMHYRVAVGDTNDVQFLRHWSHPEVASDWNNEGQKRWSSTAAKFVLPVLRGQPYEVSLDAHIRDLALEPGAGLYLGDKRIIEFDRAATTVLTGALPAVDADEVVLEVRCKNWIPKEVIPGNQDPRVLGIGVRSITLKAAGANSTTPFEVRDYK